MVPTAGLNDHVIAVLEVPVTVVPNCWLDEAYRATLEGPTVTVTGGLRLMVAMADFVGSAVLVAVSVTFCVLVMEAGAV
jgi:hypothetical protein